MLIALTISIAVNVILAIACVVVNRKRHEAYGTLLLYDNEGMVVELDDENSMKRIFASEYATFRVKHSKTH